jgi:maleylacetate reductase
MAAALDTDRPLTPGIFRASQQERVIWGKPAAQALADELDMLGSERVFVLTNRSLANSPRLEAIVGVLGRRFVGRYDGVTAHTPRECVIAGAAAARVARADKLLAVGGGSVIDGTKAMLLCLRHGYMNPEQIEPHANVRPVDLGHAPADAASWTRMIAIPTTLSGAEFASSAGVTDARRGLKQAFVNPMQIPQSVILDPEMTLDTPLELLGSTGMKAIDHAVERMTSRTANPYSDAVSELALRVLSTALSAIGSRPDDLDLRSKLQYGMFMSLRGSASGVASNVSHAIGHVLGAHAGVPHGFTTGVTLPSVLRWMANETAEPQARVAAALDAAPPQAGATGAAGALERDRAAKPASDAATAVESLATRLGLPTRLRDVGVLRDDFALIAEKTMHEALLANSRRAVQGPEDIREILEWAW